MMPDIKAKKRIAAHDLKILRQSFLKIKSVKREHKCRVAGLAVLTAFDYNCAVWPKLNRAERAEHQSARLYTLRAATCLYSNNDVNYTHEDVLAAAHMLSGEMTRRIARLRYLPRLISKGAAVLLPCLHSTAHLGPI